MSKITLFPWCGVTIRTPEACELLEEQSGFLTGSTFLPWRSVVVSGDEFTTFNETWEESCGEYGLQFNETFEDFCGSYSLQKDETWES